MSTKTANTLTLADMDRGELLALITRRYGPMPFREIDLISIKHETAQNKAELALAAREAAFNRWMDLCNVRSKQIRRTRTDELNYLAVCREASDAEAAFKRADKRYDRACAEADRLWTAWMKGGNP